MSCTQSSCWQWRTLDAWASMSIACHGTVYNLLSVLAMSPDRQTAVIDHGTPNVPLSVGIEQSVRQFGRRILISTDFCSAAPTDRDMGFATAVHPAQPASHSIAQYATVVETNQAAVHRMERGVGRRRACRPVAVRALHFKLDAAVRFRRLRNDASLVARGGGVIPSHLATCCICIRAPWTRQGRVGDDRCGPVCEISSGG